MLIFQPNLVSFDWATYLEVAKLLLNQNTEAAYRSAISRAYYSLYNVMQVKANHPDKLRHWGFIKMLKNLSNDIATYCNDIEESDLIFIGNTLDELRKERNKADYKKTESFNKRRAKNAIRKVELIFENILYC